MRRPVDGPIAEGGRFNDLRPRSNPHRPHGGTDQVAGVGVPIYAPEAGTRFHFMLRRQTKDQAWKWPLKEPAGTVLPWASYGYDLYGAVTILRSKNGERVWLFCHSYFRQLWDLTKGILWAYQEEPADVEFPMALFHTLSWSIPTEEGDVIAKVGNQGESTGPHVHYEIHRGWTYTEHEDRLDPEAVLKGEVK